ncbi:hypothetical protein FSARC_3837 [Fusarium sarcochroum]|uniref:Uncharacterized protein n=1 Tax=Fusarium sarcochroum TaxID=1208366 RepID=A0A8H4XC62_9HYPO|nr:hypothetical protein FSARC_3837 [Fusarium sarcochroum]
MATPYVSTSIELAAWKQWDESMEMVWPAVAPVSRPPTPPAVARIEHEEPWGMVPWRELQARTDAKVLRAAEAAREHLLGEIYQHLSHSEIDWSLEGQNVCRVVGMTCYGEEQGDLSSLEDHLRIQSHLDHEARLAAEFVAPVSCVPTSIPQSPTPATKMDQVGIMEVNEEIPAGRAIDTTHSATGQEHGIPLLNATKRPRSPQDGEISESEKRGKEPRRQL